MKSPAVARRAAGFLLLAASAILFGGAGALLGTCGPFTDVAADAFCPLVLEIFSLGITTGTTATTFDPTGNVSRLQMAAFLSRTVDGTLKRGGRRAALNRFWFPQSTFHLVGVGVGIAPRLLASDGLDVWAANHGDGTVSRVRGSDGVLLGTWTGANSASGVFAGTGRVFVTGETSPGFLYAFDPGSPPGAVIPIATVGNGPDGLAFDGVRFWTANVTGSVSYVTPIAGLPWTATTVSTGFNTPSGALFDGANVWVTDLGASTLLKLSPAGAILLTVPTGSAPSHPIFDGANIWVPNFSGDSVSVVRAASGAVLATLTGNGLSSPLTAAFDGERILVTSAADKVSFWKAADLAPIGNVSTGSLTHPWGACSDGVNFWVSLNETSQLARF